MRTAIVIEATKRAYSLSDCGSTMTVGELIEYLQSNYDEDDEIFISNDNGYTYGPLKKYSFGTKDYDDDEDEEEDEEYE